MKKVILDQTEAGKSGAFIEEDGTIRQFNSIDLDAAKKQVQDMRDIYHHNNKSDFWLLGEVPYELVDHVRITNKIPNTPEGRDEAIRIVAAMLKNGELNEFRVHGA